MFKMMDLDLSGDMWDHGTLSKGGAAGLAIMYWFIPPLQFFLGYYTELIGTFLEGSEEHKDAFNDTVTRVYGASFGFCCLWFVLFVLANMSWYSDLKPSEVVVEESELKESYEEKNVVSDHCSKVFRDSKGNPLIAVNNCSFEAVPKKCLGVLGKNGAGKSTMMNMLSTWYTPTQGKTMVRGMDTVKSPNAIRDFIGICNQKNLYWNTWTAYEHLYFFAGLRGVPMDEIKDTIHTFATELKFLEHLDTQMNSLSGGNKRKVALCASIIGKSEVLYLDEPSAGVDPFARDEMKNVLVKLKESKTILFTSHTMEEAEIMCDEVVIMKDGAVISAGGVTELVQDQSTGYYLLLDSSRELGQNDKVKEAEQFLMDSVKAQREKAVKEGTMAFLVKFDDCKLSDLFAFALKFNEKYTNQNVMIESASLEQLFKHVVHDDASAGYTGPPSYAAAEGSPGHVAVEMHSTRASA